ncbi:MAG: hypothetical protein WBA46_15780 [Thermomicrobiales bacterium]
MRPRPRPHHAFVHMLGVVVAVVAAVIPLLLMAGGGGSLANQSGPGMSDRLGNLNALCRLNGGTPGAYASDSIVTRFSCRGGALDGLYCDVYDDLTYCYWERVGHGAAAGGGSGVRAVTMQVRDLTFVTDLASDPVAPFAGVVPTAPMTAEAVVSRNASDDAATEARQAQINGCRHLGGTEQVAGDPGVVAETIAIGCSAGLLDGMWCTMGATSNTCFLDRSAPDRPRATSTRAPATVPTSRTETTEATEATEATTLLTATVTPEATTMPSPTSTPPTEVPVIEPTFVDPTAESPWTLPDGTLPPLEPAPTPTAAPIL